MPTVFSTCTQWYDEVVAHRLRAVGPLASRRCAGGQRFIEDPQDFTLTCTAGANGKCARLGYIPGFITPEGKPLTPYFESCVRMMRADYCGDGRPNTEAGVAVEMLDRAGRQPDWYDPSMTFEAAWGPHGAVCVKRPRDDNRLSLDDVLDRCPRLQGATGDACREDALITNPEVLLVNRSGAAATISSL